MIAEVMKAACRKCLVTAKWRGKGEEGKGLSWLTTWRSYNAADVLCISLSGPLGESAGQHQFAMLLWPPVMPGDTLCAARVQAWFTGEDASIHHGGAVRNISFSALVNLLVPSGIRAIWSGTRLCAALWSKDAVWSNVPNTGSRNSRFRIPGILVQTSCDHISAVNSVWLDWNLQKWSWFASE